MHIDEPREDGQPRRIDHLRAGRFYIFTYLSDLSPFEQKIRADHLVRKDDLAALYENFTHFRFLPVCSCIKGTAAPF